MGNIKLPKKEMDPEDIGHDIDSIGKSIVCWKGKSGNTLDMCEGGVRVMNKLNPCGCNCCFCMGWDLTFYVIPNQCILDVSIESKSQCCCVPLCFLDCCQWKT